MFHEKLRVGNTKVAWVGSEVLEDGMAFGEIFVCGLNLWGCEWVMPMA